MISAGIAALTLMPSAMPVSNPAYHASVVARRRSSASQGIANTKAANSTTASARSASEKLDPMMPIRCDVRNNTTTGAHEVGLHPTRARSAAVPVAKMAA